jgi:hypothetical protein
MGRRSHVLFWGATHVFSWKGWGTTKNPSRYRWCPAEIQTGHLLNRDQKLYCFSQLARWHYLRCTLGKQSYLGYNLEVWADELMESEGKAHTYRRSTAASNTCLWGTRFYGWQESIVQCTIRNSSQQFTPPPNSEARRHTLWPASSWFKSLQVELSLA